MARPVVLLHGMWSTGANFDRVAEGLRPRGHACYAPTLPAHEIGVVHPEVGRLGLRHYLEFLEDAVRRLNLEEPPVLVGHSMGALLAQQLAVKIQPFALVLLTPAWPAGIHGLRASNLSASLRIVSRWNWWQRPQKLSFHRAVTAAFNGVPRERHVRLYDAMVDDSGRALFEIALWMIDKQRASRVDAAAIRCPVYVVSSGEDRIVPVAAVRQLAARYPQASLRHYPHRGHWVLDDLDTDEMTAEIANWIQGHEQRLAARGRG